MALFNIRGLGALAGLFTRPLPLRYRLELRPLLRSLVPHLLRRPKMLAWLQVLNEPLSFVYAQFVLHVFTSSRELSYNGQTMLLEKALNDRFDPGFRRIRIINSDTQLEPTYLNFVSEQQPNPVTYFTSEMQPLLRLANWLEYVNQVGFTVRVPRTLRPQEPAINARIKQLKLALIRHTIAYI